MKRSAVVLSLVIGAALFLSACEITVTPTPPPPTPDESATVGSNANSAVSTKSLARGATWLYQISVPSGVRSQSEVVYLELSQDLDIRVMGASRNLLFSSSSKQFFGRGAAGLTSATVDSQAITTPVTCRGSCVIFEPGEQGTYYLQVTNNSSSSVTFDLFAFGDDFVDPFEPRNNSRNDAPLLPVSVSFDESGALETIGDVDFWYVDATGRVAFDAPNNQLAVRAERQNASGALLGSYQPGDIINVNRGEFLRVFSSNDRAAASANSIYYLSNP